jgi:hypothetical protein
MVEMLLDIDLMLNDRGGFNFLKIRYVFEDIEQMSKEGNTRAIQMKEELARLHTLLKLAIEEKTQ